MVLAADRVDLVVRSVRSACPLSLQFTDVRSAFGRDACDAHFFLCGRHTTSVGGKRGWGPGGCARRKVPKTASREQDPRLSCPPHRHRARAHLRRRKRLGRPPRHFPHRSPARASRPASPAVSTNLAARYATWPMPLPIGCSVVTPSAHRRDVADARFAGRDALA
jgi:hypothetical protein